METKKIKKLNPFLLIAIIFAIVLSASFLIYKERAVIYIGLNDLKLIPQPERFTELYFDPTSLPDQIISYQPLLFSFTVHNLEGATTTYPYKVYLEYPTGKQITFANGSITLANGAEATTNIKHIFYFSNKKLKVVVKLTAIDQSIDFLINGEEKS